MIGRISNPIPTRQASQNIFMNTDTTETASRLLIAQKSIESARAYTLTLLEDLQDDEYFWTPAGCETHIAWQVGHIAYGQYGSVLFRGRGRKLEDGDLLSTKFRKQFAKSSTPAAKDKTLDLQTIKDSFQRIYEQSLKELPHFDEHSLDDPIEPPHAAFATKYGSLIFAAHHEMLHAGQIGLIRRLMGKSPVR